MASSATWIRHEPEKSVLHRLVRENLNSLVAFAEARDPAGRGLPRYVKRAFERYLGCGQLQNGFLRLRCPDCGLDTLIPFS